MKNKNVIPKKLILAIFDVKQIVPGVFEHVRIYFNRTCALQHNLIYVPWA